MVLALRYEKPPVKTQGFSCTRGALAIIPTGWPATYGISVHALPGTSDWKLFEEIVKIDTESRDGRFSLYFNIMESKGRIWLDGVKVEEVSKAAFTKRSPAPRRTPRTGGPSRTAPPALNRQQGPSDRQEHDQSQEGTMTMKPTVTFLTPLFLAPLVAFAQQAPQPMTTGVSAPKAAAHPVSGGPVNIGSRRELFIDRFLIDRLDNASLKLHEPVSGGIAIRADKPWEGPANFGMSVIELDGRLLMYYRGWPANDAKDENGVGCVAQSRDSGATWTKPALDLVKRPDWPGNNIIATESGEPRFAFPCAPWVDTRPGVPADERVKMVQSVPVSGEAHTAMRDPAGPKRLVFWASADGFSFRKLDPQPEMISNLRNCFDGGNTMFWSEAEQQYVLYYRWYDDEWGRGHRTMARATSKDLMTWTPSVPMTYGDTPREQFYVNNTQPYFRAPHLYVAPAARFMEGRQVLDEKRAAAIGLQPIGKHVYFKDCSDGVLLTSRAGSTVYDRTFLETFVRPGPDDANWVSRTNYPLTGILPAGPGRVQMFVTRHYMQKSWHIERLLLRTDGFASVSAPWAGGEMLTKPFTFDGNTLEINYRTGAPGFVRVEIQDPSGTPIPGYALGDCPEIIGDEIARTVAWTHGPDLSRLAGQAVRLRFVIKDADLFAIRFREQAVLGNSRSQTKESRR